MKKIFFACLRFCRRADCRARLRRNRATWRPIGNDAEPRNAAKAVPLPAKSGGHRAGGRHCFCSRRDVPRNSPPRPFRRGRQADCLSALRKGKSHYKWDAARIGSHWTAAGRNGLYITDWPAEYVSANNQSDAVFVDGQMVNLARWPEETNHNLSRPREGRIAYNVRTVKTDLKASGPQYAIYDTTFFDPDFNEPDGRWKNAKVWVCNGGATDTQDGDGVTGIGSGNQSGRAYYHDSRPRFRANRQSEFGLQQRLPNWNGQPLLSFRSAFCGRPALSRRILA